MTAMMLMLINFNHAQPLLNFISIYIIAAISWLPPLISQLFQPGFLRNFFTVFVRVRYMWQLSNLKCSYHLM